MNMLLSGVCYVLTLLIVVQSTTGVHLNTDLKPLLRHARQAEGCTLPPYPTNGHYTMQSDVNIVPGASVGFFTIIFFECDHGFTPVANLSICQSGSKWSTEGKCIGISNGCIVPPMPANGRHYLENNDKLQPGIGVQPFTMLYFACNSGFKATARMAICQGSEWSTKPSCERIGGCVLPNNPDNGVYSIQNADSRIVPGSSVADFTILQYSCHEGFVISKNISVCGNGKWSPIPICEKHCSKQISNTVNLECSQERGGACPIGSVIFPSCKPGHRPDGPMESMTCLGGAWDKRPPKCKQITCSLQRSDTVSFACYDSDNLLIICPKNVVDGQSIYPSCKEGHERAGSLAVLTCRGGQWSSPMPSCVQVATTSTEAPIIDGSRCALPNFPPNGKFSVTGPNKNLAPGTIVDEFTLIVYSCNTNFDASTEMVYSTCEEGKWNCKPPICRKRCKMLTSLTVDFKCWNALNREIPCDNRLPFGTLVTSTCKSGHHTPNEDLDDLLCSHEGSFDNPKPECKPDCGLEKAVGGVQIVHGFTAKKDTFPWHVGIFQLDESKEEKISQICGGSIIHANLVVSAAHCFYNPILREQIEAKYFKVAAGKFLRSWDNDLKANVKIIQKSDVSKIYIPQTYGGDEQNQQDDLALLLLETPFKLSESIRAICYDLYQERFNSLQLQPGNQGKIAGWGRTETGDPSEELKTLELPVISYGVCRLEMSKYKFERYLTTDKLCAGHLTGRALCQGDSGGGLVFPSVDTTGSTRWYIRGVVSVGPLNDARTTCRASTYTAFTNVYKLRDWLKKTIRTVMRTSN